MKYPNSIKKEYHKPINYKNRGIELENLINEANLYYLHNDIAVIYKKPTPIGVVEVDYKNGAIINKAYYKEPSTLDYNGIYKGKYIEFDAKECLNKTSFPLNNIHPHQLKHMKRIICHGGIAFLIIYMNNKYFLYKGSDLLNFIENNTRKSIPYQEIVNHGYIIEYNYNSSLKYLEAVNKAYKGVDFDEKNKFEKE